MRRRINITLSEETVKLLDKASAPGDRSAFIDHAVRRYVAQVGRARLRKRLKEGYGRGAERDLRLAQQWFLLDEEGWQADR